MAEIAAVYSAVAQGGFAALSGMGATVAMAATARPRFTVATADEILDNPLVPHLPARIRVHGIAAPYGARSLPAWSAIDDSATGQHARGMASALMRPGCFDGCDWQGARLWMDLVSARDAFADCGARS